MTDKQHNMTAPEAVRLLVRVDDAGASQAANAGCLEACINGIARSVEVMMPGACITQAADMFRVHPDVDIGIHLTLTSEWDAVKWKPLTHAPSLVDGSGSFLPLLFPQAGRSAPCLQRVDWSLQEIADELHAQIELGLKMFPQASHISSHMIRHFKDFDARLGDIVQILCATFGLIDDPFGHGLPRFQGYPPSPRDTAFRTASFIEGLSKLPGGTHIFIDHPIAASPDAKDMGHFGYTDVLLDRVTCLETLTDPGVASSILAQRIELISYRDLHRIGLD
ncbi:MAG: ChbG/HpnK family deacetylase [Pseudomonadota bacterium]